MRIPFVTRSLFGMLALPALLLTACGNNDSTTDADQGGNDDCY